MRVFLPILAMGLFSMPGLANTGSPKGWVAQVGGIEAVFPCNGVSPDLGAAPEVNVSTSGHGEFRLKQRGSQFRLRGEALAFSGLALGHLASKPSCFAEDADEPARPEWVEVALARRVNLALAFHPDASTCHPSREGESGFNRTNAYTLTLMDRVTGRTDHISWREEGFYPSERDCRNGNW